MLCIFVLKPFSFDALLPLVAYYTAIAVCCSLVYVGKRRFVSLAANSGVPAPPEAFVKLATMFLLVFMYSALVGYTGLYFLARPADYSNAALLLVDVVNVILADAQAITELLAHLALLSGMGVHAGHAMCAAQESQITIASRERRMPVRVSFGVLNQAIALLHYLHVWAHIGVTLSIADLVLLGNCKRVWSKVSSLVAEYHTQAAVRRMFDSVSRVLPRHALVSLQGDNACAICYETLDTDATVRELHCSHRFHDACIRLWLATPDVTSCPVCRSPVMVSDALKQGLVSSAGQPVPTAHIADHNGEVGTPRSTLSSLAWLAWPWRQSMALVQAAQDRLAGQHLLQLAQRARGWLLACGYNTEEQSGQQQQPPAVAAMPWTRHEPVADTQAGLRVRAAARR